jgi:acyl-CoA dehydrogenase
MVDLDLTETDKHILDIAHGQALIGRSYARYYDKHEGELVPDVLPAAVNEPDVRMYLRDRAAETSGTTIVEALLRLEESWGSIPARRTKVALGFGLGAYILKTIGSPEQIAKWGNSIIAIALTEPGAGSDPAGVRTTAVHDPATNEWVLNGEKIFISQSVRCNAVMVLARFEDANGKRGLSTFLVEKGTPGFTVGPHHKKLGIRHWDTCSQLFTDCRIADLNHIKGDLKTTMTVFNESRPVMGAMALGVARAAMDFTRDKLKEAGIELNYAGGIGSLSALADRFIRLEALYEAAWLTVVRALWLTQVGGDSKIEASVAKAKGGRAARRITQECIELLGPSSLSEEHLVEQWFRDARIYDIFEGTGEIQRLIIARWLLDYSAKDLA